MGTVLLESKKKDAQEPLAHESMNWAVAMQMKPKFIYLHEIPTNVSFQ